MKLKTKAIPAALFMVIVIFTGLQAQEYNPVFDDSALPDIHIQIDSDSLSSILDPANAQSDHEYPARFVFNSGTISDTMGNIGFRLRGNTSRTAKKKSFKISFNSFQKGRKYHGLEKLNINGEHNDPSIIRSKLSWDIFAELGIQASRANHVKLYINGRYYGLYINVEHIDENFVKNRFGTNDGNLYKCLWPADLTYLGTNPDAYKFTSGDRRTYELKTNGAGLLNILKRGKICGYIYRRYRVFCGKGKAIYKEGQETQDDYCRENS